MVVIKEHINVKDDRLLDGLTPVVRLMTQVEALSETEAVTIDFSDTVFITPVCIIDDSLLSGVWQKDFHKKYSSLS